MIKQAIGALALAVAIASSSAMADDKLIMAGYSNAGDSHYGYVGYIQSLNGSLQDAGFRVRLVMEDMDYSYQPNRGSRHTNADATGGKALVGYQWNLSSATTLALWAGAQYRDTDLSPEDRGNHESNIFWDSTYMVELNHACSDNFGVLFQASHSPRNDEYWSRLYPAYVFSNGMRLGPDISLMKGESWAKDQYGLTLAGIKAGPVELYVGAGDEEDNEGDHAVYTRIGGSFSF